MLAACVVAFLAIVHFDGSAARDEARRAREVLADRAKAARTPKTEREWRRAGDRSLGGAGPISVPVLSAWSPGTSASVGHASAAAGGGPPPAPLIALAGMGLVMALSGSALLARARW